ncbi:bidirectional sugar transporter N3-like [Solanum stenotomum]|uniref:bidirectional sugar transporter N3-like n=1 Tax=Solanum stenotomum TaxID=172797 RepID=UPI0020D14C6B|nr:bidirectional sugar transporter N3-like [Solanum stenotomum]
MALFDLHHPWLLVFGVLGNVISILVFLAPVPAFRRICKEKSTMGYQSVPYVVALFSSMLWMYYAFIKKNAILLVSINSFGCIVETIYITIFILYASKESRRQTVRLLVLLIGGLYTLIFLITLFPLNGVLRVQVVGWICVTVAVGVFAAPLSIVFQVVRTKSVEFMPFTLSFFLTLSAIMWFGYGLLLKDLCIALPNVLGFFLGMIQMLLYGIYRNAKPSIDLEKKVCELVINSEQIHPLDSEDINSNDEQGINTAGVVPVSVANNNDNEERLGEQLAQVNLQPLQTPVLVVCAA